MWLEEALGVFTRLTAIKTSVAKSFCEHLNGYIKLKKKELTLQY